MLLSLNQVVSLRSNVLQKSEHIHFLLDLSLFDHGVNADVCPGPAHASGAVDDNRSAIRWVARNRLPDERQSASSLYGVHLAVGGEHNDHVCPK